MSALSSLAASPRAGFARIMPTRRRACPAMSEIVDTRPRAFRSEPVRPDSWRRRRCIFPLTFAVLPLGHEYRDELEERLPQPAAGVEGAQRRKRHHGDAVRPTRPRRDGTALVTERDVGDDEHKVPAVIEHRATRGVPPSAAPDAGGDTSRSNRSPTSQSAVS